MFDLTQGHGQRPTMLAMLVSLKGRTGEILRAEIIFPQDLPTAKLSPMEHRCSLSVSGTKGFQLRLKLNKHPSK